MDVLRKGFVNVFLVLVIAIIGVGSLVYFAYRNGQREIQILQPTPSASVTISPTESNANQIDDLTASWEKYVSNNGYSLKYPPNWIAKSSVPGAGEVDLVPTSRGFTAYAKEFAGVTSIHPRISVEAFDAEQESNLGVTDFVSWVESSKKNQFFAISKTTNTEIDNIETVILEGNFSSGDQETYHKAYLTHTTDNSKYIFILLDEYNGDYRQTFDQILSTFRIE